MKWREVEKIILGKFMIITVENLGAIRYAEMEIGNFTIICGKNNCGKTYVTYALYGFLKFWKHNFELTIEKDIIKNLKHNGVVNIDLSTYTKNAQDIIKVACYEYTKSLASVYSAQDKLLEDSSFEITINDTEVQLLKEDFTNGIKASSAKSEVMMLRKNAEQSELTVTLFAEAINEELPEFIIINTLSDAIKKIVFGNLFPNCFIASAERTGAAIFRQELNFARNKLLNKVIKKDVKINPIELIKREKSDYALPVEDNVEFTRNLESLSKSNSFLINKKGDVLEKFLELLGGDYQVSKNGDLHFIPQRYNVKLTMDESSSAVRSLLDIGFYLKHVADKNDLLMIDEPELNLHPENQRKIARLLATLVNCGMKVFITTHSDYILRELSNLILLNSDKPHVLEIIEKEGYQKSELLNAKDFRIYVAEIAKIKIRNNMRKSTVSTLTQTDVNDESGIQTSCFDDTIDTMNRIQDEITFGG